MCTYKNCPLLRASGKIEEQEEEIFSPGSTESDFSEFIHNRAKSKSREKLAKSQEHIAKIRSAVSKKSREYIDARRYEQILKTRGASREASRQASREVSQEEIIGEIDLRTSQTPLNAGSQQLYTAVKKPYSSVISPEFAGIEKKLESVASSSAAPLKETDSSFQGAGEKRSDLLKTLYRTDAPQATVHRELTGIHKSVSSEIFARGSKSPPKGPQPGVSFKSVTTKTDPSSDYYSETEVTDNRKKSSSTGRSTTSRSRSRSRPPSSEDMEKFDKTTSIDKQYVGKPRRKHKEGTDSYTEAMKKKRKEEKKSKKHKKTPDYKHGTLLPPQRSPLRLLLAFPVQDQVFDAVQKAGEKLSFDVTVASSEDAALEDYQSRAHDIVIIDSRSSRNIDYETLCRSIRNSRGSQHSVVVAVVKKSVYEKDETTVTSILEAGFNRCIVESPNMITCYNDMVQLKYSDVQSQSQGTTTQAFYTALDKCKDLVLITDDHYKLQYANKANERYLGYRAEELLGKPLTDQVIQDAGQLNAMTAVIHKGKTYTGALTLRKKSQDGVLPTTCKAVPVTCMGRHPTHYVMVFDTSNFLDPTQQRGSVHSLRRRSSDQRSVVSDHLRRTSLAKLNALPLEAPITKIIALIDQARESSNNNAQVITLLDKAEDILRTPELYSPHVKDDIRVKSDEPIASDLITALLSKQPQLSFGHSSRRSSNDSAIYRPSRPGGVIKATGALKELLETALHWDFDIFRLEDMTKRRPLQSLGMNLFAHFDAASVLSCDEKTLYNWLTVVEANYRTDNHYHNSTHAADVMQATAGFLEKERLKSIMEPMDEVTCLIAAASHDIDHPGKSSAFLSNSDNPLAILYNDVTVLENHHAALTFKLTLGDDRVNIFKNLDRETYKIARHNIIDMILATEMTKHFEHLAKFVNVFCTKPSGSDIEIDIQEYVPLTLPENITLIKRMMIKCADVSNPTRPMNLCIEWAIRIAEEYFQQTDEEKLRSLPVVMPMFDRASCSIPKSQIGFVDYIIHDMFEAWNAFVDMPELTNFMRLNYVKWKEYDENGHTTLQDLEVLKKSLTPVPSQTKKKPGE